MATERLFYKNVYQKEFKAMVKACRQTDEGYQVILDRTLFYPEGGGQPADHGILDGIPVYDVQYEGEEICHMVKEPLREGKEVTGMIDWERRFDLMQQHSGEHIVSGMIHEKYGYENVGFHMGEERITIDLSGPLTLPQVKEIEDKVNDYLWENRETNIFYPDEEERNKISYRSKKELTGEVRLVEFPGADLCACCGLHVSRTGEIGMVRIISCKKFREGVRLEMLSGKRAFRYLSMNEEQNARVAVSLSVKEEETANAVDRLQKEIYELKGQLKEEKQKRFAGRAEALTGKGNVFLFEEAMDAAEVRKCTDAILDTCGGIAVLLSGNDTDGYKYAAGQRDGNVRELVGRMNKKLNGRGGGKPFFAQGYLNADRKQVEEFFREEGFYSGTC